MVDVAEGWREREELRKSREPVTGPHLKGCECFRCGYAYRDLRLCYDCGRAYLELKGSVTQCGGAVTDFFQCPACKGIEIR